MTIIQRQYDAAGITHFTRDPKKEILGKHRNHKYADCHPCGGSDPEITCAFITRDPKWGSCSH